MSIQELMEFLMNASSISFSFAFSLTKLLVEIMSGVLFIIIANSIIFLAVCLFQMETVIII